MAHRRINRLLFHRVCRFIVNTDQVNLRPLAVLLLCARQDTRQSEMAALKKDAQTSSEERVELILDHAGASLSAALAQTLAETGVNASNRPSCVKPA